MFSKSLTKHFKGFASGFTELHAKLDADTLLDSAIHRRQNETPSRKINRVETMRVHCALSRGRLYAIVCGSVTLASPLIFFQRGSYNNISPKTFLVFGIRKTASGDDMREAGYADAYKLITVPLFSGTSHYKRTQ
jgi:hypothetical protein